MLQRPREWNLDPQVLPRSQVTKKLKNSNEPDISDLPLNVLQKRKNESPFIASYG